MKGKVKWFNNKKGFGFITDENNKDVFVHYSGIMAEGYKTLEQDVAVEFEVKDTDKGLQAVDVKLV